MVAALGLTANITVGLWARSTVESVAYDTARRIAETPRGVDTAAQARVAVSNARTALGPTGSRVDLIVESTGPEEVRLRVRYPGVGLLPRLVRSGPVVGAIDRVVSVRREGAT